MVLGMYINKPKKFFLPDCFFKVSKKPSKFPVSVCMVYVISSQTTMPGHSIHVVNN